jgi:phage FluMu gp28-like protein
VPGEVSPGHFRAKCARGSFKSAHFAAVHRSLRRTLPYQGRWVSDRSRVKVCEKSRRIGISWADAGGAALDAARLKGHDTWYLGYNKDMAEQYISDVAWWAKAYNLVASAIEKEVVKDEDQDILVFRVRFATGYKVSALSSKPANLRAKKGAIVIDEAAFHQDLNELRKAAMAVLAWGGQVRIISTHDGVDNLFNQLCQEIRSGELIYSLHKMTLLDAVDEGLYKRICLMNGWSWALTESAEGIATQQQWIDQLYKDYGIGADEELGCIPLDAKGGGKVFNRNWFRSIDAPSGGYDAIVRFWDMAATAKAINEDAFYTAGVLLGIKDNFYDVLDAIAQQLDPAGSDQLIIDTAKRDGKGVFVAWEEEGGSAGKRVTEYLKQQLKGCDADGVKPQGDKLTRAKPVAIAIHSYLPLDI